jgi:hypothetical protein
MGGVAGSIHHLLFTLQLPAISASNLWGAPGVATSWYMAHMDSNSVIFFCADALAIS